MAKLQAVTQQAVKISRTEYVPGRTIGISILTMVAFLLRRKEDNIQKIAMFAFSPGRTAT